MRKRLISIGLATSFAIAIVGAPTSAASSKACEALEGALGRIEFRADALEQFFKEIGSELAGEVGPDPALFVARVKPTGCQLPG